MILLDPRYGLWYEKTFCIFCADALGNTLAGYADKPRVYIGCMKSGKVFSEQLSWPKIWISDKGFRKWAVVLIFECYSLSICINELFLSWQEPEMVWTRLVEVWGWKNVSRTSLLASSVSQEKCSFLQHQFERLLNSVDIMDYILYFLPLLQWAPFLYLFRTSKYH